MSKFSVDIMCHKRHYVCIWKQYDELNMQLDYIDYALIAALTTNARIQLLVQPRTTA